MTPWDAGQDVIACSDLLGEKADELRKNGFLEFADVLQESRLKIGDVFNRIGTHSFGLASNEPYPPSVESRNK